MCIRFILVLMTNKHTYLLCHILHILYYTILYALCLCLYIGVSAEPLPRAPCPGDDRLQDLPGHTRPGMCRCSV